LLAGFSTTDTLELFLKKAFALTVARLLESAGRHCLFVAERADILTGFVVAVKAGAARMCAED